MTVKRLQGFGLLISAVGVLLGYFGPSATWCHALVWVGAILFILGIPAVHAAQQDGTAGLVGILLLEIGAIISLLFQWNLVSGGVLSLVGALAYCDRCGHRGMVNHTRHSLPCLGRLDLYYRCRAEPDRGIGQSRIAEYGRIRAGRAADRGCTGRLRIPVIS